MKHLAVLIAGLAFSTVALEAQGPPGGVPDSHRPPPGMCRIWIDGVPPAHQPAPTDCATAIRKRPANARVVFGNEPAGVERGFSPSRAPQMVAPTPVPVPSNQPNNQPNNQTNNQTINPPNTPSREEIDRATREREEQDRQHEAQRVEEEKRVRRAPSPPPTQHENHPNDRPRSHPRVEKSPSRPPSHSFSGRRPR